MKKFLAAVTAIIMVLSLVAIPVAAEKDAAPQEGDVIFDIRNPETENGLYYALPGETVTVEFTVTGEYEAHGANINFNFDPEMLTIESLEEGPAMAEIRQVALPTLDYETVPGSIKLGIMAPTDPFSAQGVIYTVSFKVAETAELDTVLPLEIEIAEFFNMPVNGEATPIPCFAYNSGIVSGEIPPVLPEEITVEPISILVGETADAVYTVLPEGADDKSVTFAIADETIATVDENGVVTGIAVGETEITVTSVANPEVSGTAAVTVAPGPEPGDSIFDLGGVHPANAGGLVAVELTLTGEFEAHGANIWLNYDPEMVTIEKVREGAVIDEVRKLGGEVVLDYETVPGSLRLALMCPEEPFTANGRVIRVFFRVAEGLEDGTVIPLELLVNEFFNMPVDGENTPLPYFIYPGSIVIDSIPHVPPTGFVSLAGAGISAILAGAGVVLLRKKRDRF